MPEEIIMLEDLEEVVDNKYLAVNIAARRARRLNEGERSVITSSAKKPSTIALQELVQGKLEYRLEEAPIAVVEEETPELEEALLDEEEGLLDEVEYVDDTDMITDDEEPEEGL